MSADVLAQLRVWLTALVAGLVTAPAEISVDVGKAGRRTVLFVLAVAPNDVGRITGKGGWVIKSLRALVASAGARHGLRVRLELEDEAGRR